MKIDSSELSEFVKATIKGIQKGTPEGTHISGPIEFDLSIVNEKSGGGGLTVHILEAGGKYKAEEVSRIKFKVREDTPDPYNLYKEDDKNWRIGS